MTQLSEQNRALILSVHEKWTARDVDAGYIALPESALNRLLDAARAEGRPSPEGEEDAFEREIGAMLAAGLKGRTHDVWERAHNAGLRAALAAYRALSTPSPERAEGAPAGEAWRPISELVETVQEGFMLVWPTTAGAPEVWANQTYFEALRRGTVPGWTHLFEDAKAVTHFQPVPLPSEDHLKSDGAALSQPSQVGMEEDTLDRVARAWGLLRASVADGHTRSGHNVQSARRVLGNLLTEESKRGGIAMLSDDELLGPDDTMGVFPLPPAPAAEPVRMKLWCPSCGLQHIDEPSAGWDNPPHRSHLCLGCSHIWRPADVPTMGVAEITTRGEFDSPIPAQLGLSQGEGGSTAGPWAPTHRHLKSGGCYQVLHRGRDITNHRGDRGVEVVVYQGVGGEIWIREAAEFDDGRFEAIG